MKFPWIATVAVALSLTSCGQQQPAGSEASAPAVAERAQAAETYSGTGKVTANAGDQVTIDHGPIEGIGWPPMRMSFTAPAGMATRIGVGSDVSFAFRQDGSAYVLTRLQRR